MFGLDILDCGLNGIFCPSFDAWAAFGSIFRLVCRKRSLAETFLGWLGSAIRHPQRRGSITTAPAWCWNTTRRMSRCCGRCWSAFKNASLADIKSLVASSQTPTVPANARSAPPAVSKRFPLALPTVSLLMAFSANPVVVGRQPAADAVERAADRAARLEGVATRDAGSTSTCSTRWRSPPRCCRAIRWPAAS